VHRFSEFLKQFDDLIHIYRTDFELFKDEFNFETAREAFEQKRLEFVLKLDSTGTDVLNKLLAIPIGQGLLVSQLKPEASASLGNIALVLSSLVFAFIAAALISNQKHSLDQIETEIGQQKILTTSRFPLLGERLKSNFAALAARAKWHRRLPWMLGFLLVFTTLYTVYAFSEVSPGKEWWATLQAVFCCPSPVR